MYHDHVTETYPVIGLYV